MHIEMLTLRAPNTCVGGPDGRPLNSVSSSSEGDDVGLPSNYHKHACMLLT